MSRIDADAEYKVHHISLSLTEINVSRFSAPGKACPNRIISFPVVVALVLRAHQTTWTMLLFVQRSFLSNSGRF